MIASICYKLQCILVSNMSNSWARRLTAVVTIVCMIVAVKAETNCTDDLRQNGPIISPCQSEIILEAGQNFTLTCRGKTPLNFKQQEVPEEVIGPFRIEQKNTSDLDDESMFETVLELYNVDRFAIGYYACYDDTVNGSDILNNLTEEPNNTEHIAFIYIYVAGTDSLFAPLREVIVPRKQCKVVIECRPTTPDVEVSLTSQSSKTPESIKYSPKIGFLMRTCSRNAYKCQGLRGSEKEWKHIRNVRVPPVPTIHRSTPLFLKGENFTLSCSVAYQPDTVVNLYWVMPTNVRKDSVIASSNDKEIHETYYKNITIINATKDHGGNYTCVAKNNCGEKSKSFVKQFLPEARLKLTPLNRKNPIITKQRIVKINTELEDYPPANFYFLRNNVSLPQNNKFDFYRHPQTADVILSIKNTNVSDSANYTLVVSNGYLKKNHTYELLIKAKPTIDFGPKVDKKYEQNTQASLQCVVTGYPLPEVTWIFSNGEDQTMPSTQIYMHSKYQETAILDIPVHASGDISCKASNSEDTAVETRRLLVYEIHNGFGIRNREKSWFSENEDVTITCIASIYDFYSVTWLGPDGEDLRGTNAVEYTNSSFSLLAKLKFSQISLNHSGLYTCQGSKLNSSNTESEDINITVAPLQSPIIKIPEDDQAIEVVTYQEVELTCQAEGVPPPKLEWHKDGVLMDNETNAKIYIHEINRTIVNSSIRIDRLLEENQGTYECLAISAGLTATRLYTVALKASSYELYLSIILVVIFVLIIVVLYLMWRVRKDTQFRKELKASGLLYFNEGATKSLNPDLGIDEQADLLPYDEKFEFPADKLILGKQLGAGAFGVVYKADARGIINAEETTEVAVKMVKKTADNMYIKALASELKIMVHLGKHINIVNLLGACTKNVVKRELIVIVEYCKFGNIHNYMQRHREVFIDQLTDNKEKNLGRVNRGFSSSSGSTGAHSDYFASCTQDTDHTFVNTANTNRSTRKDNQNQQVEFVKVSEGYVQPEWRTNYESDYSFDGRNPRPLTSRDLLVWAFQIARGMEYLASRKVLHGDLAARNVLLAEDNIVKICDFGLARSIYKNDEYQKKENCLLPVKWLAIECMTDRIFSTQSDVWSFGIVLWELFSLAKTPYPNISPAHLLQWLSEGKRLEKPPYADDRLYNVMMRCWEQKPTSRPSFSQLQEILGGFLEDNVRNHYVDLNTAYMDTNVKPGGEDYLAMVCAPDYNNLVTPSPHHYVNDRSFFPTTPTQIDEEGYLQMSPASRQNIFSPRAQDMKFDFDSRKFNPRVSEASSCGSELTPMLTLNNLPARSGSESDHEGNASPYLNMCPRIDEEADDVFETNQNNAKNALNTAHTNPTYISLDVDIEKKPKDIINSYINVPNGLVK
ncbi:vascular endothelial growth factor receptor 1 isoform X4 [Spodoptera frugiperda]|uniref:receptor protein-tyrosine kinase n=2 Tax=Spodoptera frugiperda TaxID=7108 RepID=A0A9R0E9R5_SPOFR|nr:vascular endothelial growth factor receptor 1 isoform X4 [Spodoptera frugiperda]